MNHMNITWKIWTRKSPNTVTFYAVLIEGHAYPQLSNVILSMESYNLSN